MFTCSVFVYLSKKGNEWTDLFADENGCDVLVGQWRAGNNDGNVAIRYFDRCVLSLRDSYGVEAGL